ncbi:MAG TPA: hypothetical protein VNX88_15280 [Terriglobales bacterium]|jgi:hypothetical protein|nr:hypothetical protein [Terriglobales bacterium]
MFDDDPFTANSDSTVENVLSHSDTRELSGDSSQTQTDRRRTCAGLTRTGAPCRARVSEGDFCSLHANPERAADLGRRSGAARRRSSIVERTLRDFPPPETIAEIKGILAQVLVDLCAGRIDGKDAYAVAYIANVLMKTEQLLIGEIP